MPLTPASTGVRLHDRQHLARHVDHDLVGVAVGEQAGERAAARHAVAAGVVNDDEVDAACLLAFRGQPGAGAAADDGLAARDHARAACRGSACVRCGPWFQAPRSARAGAGRARDLAERGDQRRGERFVVDVVRQANELAIGPARNPVAIVSNSARSAAGSWNGLSGRVEARHAALRESGSAPAPASG